MPLCGFCPKNCKFIVCNEGKPSPKLNPFKRTGVWGQKSLFCCSLRERKIGEILFGPGAGWKGRRGSFLCNEVFLVHRGWGVPVLLKKSVVIVVIDRLPWIKRGIMWVGASQYLTAGSFHCLRSCGSSVGGLDLLVRRKYQPGRLKNITLARIKTLPRNNEPTNPPRIKTKTCNFQCFLNISDVTASPHFILLYLRQCFCFSALKQPSEWVSFFW